jgi:hypothetical protein
MGRTESYVVSLLERLLGPVERGKRYTWARGDASPTTGRSAMLPFDAVWERRLLIVEIDEDQHREATPLFDKPHRLTVSGVHRGKQRRVYDARKRSAAAARGYRIVAIEWSRRRRPQATDLDELRARLVAEGVVDLLG